MAENSLEGVARIARNAIEEIDRLVRRQSSVASTPNSNASNSSHVLTQPSSVSAPRNAEPQRSALTELRRRFPTLNSNSSSSSGSGRRYAAVGRPGRNVVVRDLIIVGFQVEKTPLGRHDRLKLEQNGRVVAGFSIDKRWSENVLYDKVKAQFPADCKELDFEFVKNVGGVLIKPNLATGVKIDANILLRSIASTGCVYVRLFADDLDDESDLMTNPFDISSGEVSGTALRSLDTANMEESTERTGRIDLTSDEEGEKEISDFVEEIIKECEQNQNTTEILRVAQNRILTGIPLDITDASREITGETNYILVDRNNILETGISEISTITNF